MTVKKQKTVKTKKSATKTSRKAPREKTRTAAGKKIKIPAKKLPKAPQKKTRTQPKKKTAKTKITLPKSDIRKLIKKVKKKPAPKVKKPKKRPSITSEQLTKKAEDERNITLRRYLINKRQDILREAKNEISKYIKGETRQLVESALDDGDWSVIDLSEDISLRQLSAHRENLLKIDEALRKLDEGTYGQCEECGEPISDGRLKVLPFAIYCIDCQERLEQMKKIELEEGRY